MTNIKMAEKEGKCAICGKLYKKGTHILWDKLKGKYVEADCYFPDKKNTRSINTKDTSSEKGTNVTYPVPSPLTLKKIHELIDLAKEIQQQHEDTQLNKEPSVDSILSLLQQKQSQEFSLKAEAYRQIHKESNMKNFKRYTNNG